MLDDLDKGPLEHVLVDLEQVVFGDAGAVEQVFFGRDGWEAGMACFGDAQVGEQFCG